MGRAMQSISAAHGRCLARRAARPTRPAAPRGSELPAPARPPERQNKSAPHLWDASVENCG
jgi:hypothetical protein